MKFFKIITANITPKSKLKLPCKFVGRYGTKVPKKVRLEIPTGVKWKVEVKKSKGEIWLGKGWYEFAKSLGIKYGHFFMFDYDVMHAIFHIVAIGMSATEIEYPALINIDDVDDQEDQGVPRGWLVTKSLKVEEDDDVVYVNDSDSDSDSEVGRKRSNNAQSQFHVSTRKKAKASHSMNEQVNNIESEAEKVETDQNTMKRGYHGKEIIRDDEGNIRCVVQGRNVTSAQTENAIKRARAFKADEPVSIIALQPSYVWQESYGVVKQNCRLCFPLSFMEAYVILTIEDVKLRTNNGRTWTVNYRLAKHENQSFLTSGWKQFAIDNDLKVGDVCMFELIKGSENAMKVLIFRVKDEDDAPD